MIAHLRGQLLDNDGDTIVVDVAGVGYQVWSAPRRWRRCRRSGAERARCTCTRTSSRTSRCGSTASPTPSERRLFQTLLGVQGVGPRVALAILAGLPSGELVRASPAATSRA